MLKILGLAALSDLIGFLKKEDNFFSLEKEKRAGLLKSSFGQDYPDVFLDYLQKTDSDRFLTEIKNALEVFDQSTLPDPKNAFLDALAKYLSQDFGLKFDQLNIPFFFTGGEERAQTLSKLFPGVSLLHETVRDFVFHSTYQEIGMMAQSAMASLKASPVVLIQTPVELNSILRQSVRSYLLERYSFSFPEFQVTPQIVGGMRLFAGGKVVDHSWMGRIQSLTRLTQLTT